MKNLIKISLLMLTLFLPVQALAQEKAGPQQDIPAMNCPMMENMKTMHQEMGGMMHNMQSMMEDTADPAMKERMQAMHDRMASMRADMQHMQGMRGRGMMGGSTMMEQSDETTTDMAPETPKEE